MCETKIDLSHQICTMDLTSNQHMCFLLLALNVRRLNRMCHNRQWHRAFAAARCSYHVNFEHAGTAGIWKLKKPTFVLSSMQMQNKSRQTIEKVNKNAVPLFFLSRKMSTEWDCVHRFVKCWKQKFSRCVFCFSFFFLPFYFECWFLFWGRMFCVVVRSEQLKKYEKANFLAIQHSVTMICYKMVQNVIA